MLPRLMRASGLSGLSSSDLKWRQGLIKVAEVFVDAAQIDEGIGVVGLSSSDLEEARA